MERDEQFQKHLLETFRLEAEEHLQGMSSSLIELEKGVPEEQAQLVETVFREAHSLKGAARSVGRSDIESLCQAMEGLFSGMKRGEVGPSPRIFDLLQQSVDLLTRLLATAEALPGEEEKNWQRELVRKLGAARVGATSQGGATAPPSGVPSRPAAASEPAVASPPGGPPQAEVVPSAEPKAPRGGGPSAGSERPVPERKPAARDVKATPAVSAETVRVSWGKLSAVLLLSEEMLSAKLSARQRALRMRAVRSAFTEWRKEWSRVTPEVQKLVAGAARAIEVGTETTLSDGKDLHKVLEFLTWNSAFIRSLEARYGAQTKEAEQDSRSLGGMVDNLLADVKKAMMFPFSSLLESFPKIVRDLSRDNGKEADLVVRGEEIEIDRRILEEMKDPLIHLVRNSIDHGIEKPEEREARKKPRRGRITINIAPRDDKAEIVVSDDGAGISPAQVRSALLKMGALSPEKVQGLGEGELLPFIFYSGLSTSPIITDVSGHGLGLAIVKEKVEKLGGTVSVESLPDSGTTFRLVLPLSVATFRGILVRVGERIFVLPATHVDRAVRLRDGEIRTVENRETVTLSGTVVSLARLGAVLELPEPRVLPGELQAVVVTAGDQRLAFLVDEVLGEQEVLLKSLGPQLARVRNIAGATVLGSGKVAPILNVADLVKSAARMAGAPFALPAQREGASTPGRKVLVVEDSITSRTLLTNILESAGYSVATAVDGVDAFTRLKGEPFDVVVSDVEMPRMDGFELTTRIRQDHDLAELPVVLVTALGTRGDRERGVDVGANAYIVKSSFDQSNLLEVVRRLC